MHEFSKRRAVAERRHRAFLVSVYGTWLPTLMHLGAGVNALRGFAVLAGGNWG
jgi:hypothetical protein